MCAVGLIWVCSLIHCFWFWIVCVGCGVWVLLGLLFCVWVVDYVDLVFGDLGVSVWVILWRCLWCGFFDDGLFGVVLVVVCGVNYFV